ncbi:unnamed protein product [Withania somnifera]
MDMEVLFLNDFSIQKKPDNLLDLIERAVEVAEWKYPAELEKRRNRIIKSMLHPGKLDYDDDTSTLDEEEEDCAGDEDEEEKQQITAPTNQKPTMKIKLIIKKRHNNCNAIEELKKTSQDGVNKQLDANKKGTRQSHSTTTMGSRNRNMSTQVAPPLKKLLPDFSFEKQLDGHKQLKKQSHKSFKKMENLTGNKSEERKECTSALTKRMPPPLMKMNEATKIVASTPHQKLLSDCSPKKQSNGSAIMRPMQKTTQSSEVVRPTQKETESIRDENMKFESSKRKFEERFAEQRKAKRRIITVDFHNMPKPANDSRAPKRHCWNRRRF